MTPPALVVKLGGSFLRAGPRAAWLRAIAAWGGDAVLVPGGGPFADAVRDAQAAMGFSDSAAHLMALLAMAQFGLAVADGDPRLRPAGSVDAIETTLRDGFVPVWLPWPMLRGAPDVAESWDVTSDSLALWLAMRLQAPRLLLVKQAQGGLDLLDAAFPRLLSGYAGEVFVAGPDDLVGQMDAAAPPGRRLALQPA